MARLLLVDDDRDQVEIRKLIMEGAGHQVWTACGPDAAVAAYEESRPDVILMDLRLPRTEDGLALIREFRSRSAEVSIVVLSGLADNFSAFPEQGLVNRFLRKPVRSQQLLGVIRKLA